VAAFCDYFSQSTTTTIVRVRAPHRVQHLYRCHHKLLNEITLFNKFHF